MAEELLDLVNEKDEVIGTTTKKEAHARGLAHRCAAVFVFYKGKLLAQRRAPEFNGLLDQSVGGHITKGESYVSGAVREMSEELGINVPLKFVGNFYSGDPRAKEGDNHQTFFGLFEADLTDAQYQALKPDPIEVRALVPMTLEEVAQQMRTNQQDFCIGFQDCFNFYIKKHNMPIEQIVVA